MVEYYAELHVKKNECCDNRTMESLPAIKANSLKDVYSNDITAEFAFFVVRFLKAVTRIGNQKGDSP